MIPHLRTSLALVTLTVLVHQPACPQPSSFGVDDDDDDDTASDDDAAADFSCIDRDIGSEEGVPVRSGSTDGMIDDLYEQDSACPYETGGHDLVFKFTASDEGTCSFATWASQFDTVLVLKRSCDGPEVACNDDDGDTAQSYIVEYPVSPGDEFVVLLDGYGEAEEGYYELHVFCDY